MKINYNINTTIITDNNQLVLDELKDQVVVSDLKNLRTINTKFIVFNDALRTLNNSEKTRLFNNMEMKGIHFINITSDLEECLYAHELIVINKGKIYLEGSTLSVLKEERILKRLGYKLPFVIDLSLQLNSYNILDSIFLDEELLVNKLW